MENKFEMPTFPPSPLKIEELCQQINDFISRQGELQVNLCKAWAETGKGALDYQEGMASYLKSFTEPQQQAIESFFQLQQEKAGQLPSLDEFKSFAELIRFNLELAGRALNSSLSSMAEFHLRKLCEAWVASVKSIIENDVSGTELFSFISNQAELLEKVVHDYPEAIRAIKNEYGFHFDRKGFVKTAETDRFYLYQVLPSDPKTKVREQGKPVLLIPPYVLGENILCFLHGERKSYAHAFADQGVPTYVRVVKDIASTPAVQDMNGEDDVRDMRLFCEKIKARHGRPATLNGYCQGGFFATLAVLSGQLEGLVDTLITCVSPLDGTRSRALSAFMREIPEEFTALDYAISHLPNGKPVVNGRIMSWVYKLKSIDTEAPLVTFFRDLAMFDKLQESGKEISKTACAINYWLLYDQADMPVEVTRQSFASYTTPVTADGTLPVTLFGQKLNFKYIEKKKINFLICVAAADDLVDREAALAPCDYIKPEVTIFPKGHAAIATSWSHPESQCALHTVFGDNYRGPVRFHLDLEAEEDAKAVPAVKPRAVTVKEKKLPAQAKKTAPATGDSKTGKTKAASAKKPAAAKSPAPKATADKKAAASKKVATDKKAATDKKTAVSKKTAAGKTTATRAQAATQAATRGTTGSRSKAETTAAPGKAPAKAAPASTQAVPPKPAGASEAGKKSAGAPEPAAPKVPKAEPATAPKPEPAKKTQAPTNRK